MNIIHHEQPGCKISEKRLWQKSQALILENDLLSVTVLPGKGAEIHSLSYKPKDTDVLWKTPWTTKEFGTLPLWGSESSAIWLEHYAGGWQEIFPNVGDECTYKGARLSFHGEASLLPWTYEIVENTPERIAVRFSVTLFHSPFTLVRMMILERDRAILTLSERVRNEAAERMEFIWGHHPAFGSPFLSGECVVDTSAKIVQADDRYDPASNFLPPGEEWSWPTAKDKTGEPKDLSKLPAPDEGVSCLAYLKDFNEGWYAITNKELEFGIGFIWPKDIFPYAFYWQEACASMGFPFYGRAYTVAIEPFSSYPGQGLVNVMEKTGAQLSLEPGAELRADLRIVFYEGSTGVKRIFPDGRIELK